MSVRRDNVDRAKLLQKAFPTCFHIFARKRGKAVEEQVDTDDHLLYILPAADEAQVQERALARLDRDTERRLKGCSSAFHLVFTRECAGFNAFKELSMCKEFGGWQQFDGNEVIGAVYRDLGKRGKVHKNHT